MKSEPSILLIDDMPEHEAYLRMMKLDAEGWTVECVIDATVSGALAEARRKVRQYGGFSVIVLDILWKHNKYGGCEIIMRLWKSCGKRVPARRVLIVTRGGIRGDPVLEQLAEKLRIPLEMRSFQLETAHGRDRLKRAVQRTWQEVAP
jgi:CheY-like chemotaxis protein